MLEHFKNLQARNMITPRAIRRGKVKAKMKSFTKNTHKEQENAKQLDKRFNSVKASLRRQQDSKTKM